MNRKIKRVVGKDQNGQIMEVREYDKRGNLTYEFLHDVFDGSTLEIKREYDKHNNITRDEKIDELGCHTVDTYQYKYDKNNNPIEIIKNGGECVIKQVFDENGRLLMVRMNDMSTSYFVYDQNGRLVRKILKDTDYIYRYDKNGNVIYNAEIMITGNQYNIISEVYSDYDSKNNLIHQIGEGEEEEFYSYNENNQLIYYKFRLLNRDIRADEINEDYPDYEMWRKYNSKGELSEIKVLDSNGVEKIITFEYEYYK